MNKKTALLITLSAIMSLYLVISLPGTIQLNKKIDILEKKFWETAKKPDSIKLDEKGEGIILGYNGRLNKIIQKRDELARKYHAHILSSWTVSGKEQPGKDGYIFYIEVKTATTVFKPWLPRGLKK